jgi:hypothetical protein
MRVPVEKSAFCSTLTRGWSRFALLSLSILGVALVGAAPVLGQAPAASPARAKAPMAHAATHRGKGGGMHEGIKVHGWWTIEVRNPKGKLLSHTEFENKIAAFGPQNIEQILSGWMIPGGWFIALSDPKNTTTGSPCTGHNGAGQAGNCYIVQPTAVYLFEYNSGQPLCPNGINSDPCNNSLGLSITNPGQGNSSLVLQGSITATQSGNVGAVGTWLVVCSPNGAPGSLPFAAVTPVQCASNASLEDTAAVTITSANLPSSNTTTTPCGGMGQISCEVNVPEAGDSINVSVALSFQ